MSGATTGGLPQAGIVPNSGAKLQHLKNGPLLSENHKKIVSGF